MVNDQKKTCYFFSDKDGRKMKGDRPGTETCAIAEMLICRRRKCTLYVEKGSETAEKIKTFRPIRRSREMV